MLLSVLLHLRYASLPLTIDEGAYAYVAYWWQRGAVLYRDVWDGRPQGLYLLYVLAMKTFGESPEGLRIFAALYGSLTCIPLFFVGYFLGGARLGILSAIFYGFVSTEPAFEGYYPNAELFMVVPATASAYVLLLGCERESRILLALAGATAGLAFLTKQSGVAAALLAVLYPTVLAMKERRFTGLAAGLASTLLGFGGIIAPSVIHGLATAPADYLAAVFHYGWPSLDAGTQLDNAVNSLGKVAPGNMPLVLLGALGAVWLKREVFFVAWVLTCVAGMAVGGGWFPHYYVQLAPPLALAAAQGVLAYPRVLPFAIRRHLQISPFLAASLACALLIAARGAAPPRLLGPQGQPAYSIVDEMGEYLREHTAPEETVYVAYDGAHVIYESNRRSAEKYLDSPRLFTIPGAYDGLLSILESPHQRPSYILANPNYLVGPNGPGDQRFALLLGRYYAPETEFPGRFVAYRRKSE